MKKNKLFILGPCAIESRGVFLKELQVLEPIMRNENWFYKGSFDKGNRTSIKGERGIGLDEAIRIWKEFRQMFSNVKFITDVHECWQVQKLAGVVDAIQIPAFLCRQTDLVVECAKHFDKINIKKMQCLGPENLKVLVDKVRETNPKAEVWLCDRGSNLGYDHLVMDFTYINEMKKFYDRVLIDATHATQRSRKIYGVQGDRKLAMKYFLIAGIMNYDGVFAECHPNPQCAISDGDCQIELSEIEALMECQFNIDQAFHQTFQKGII